MKPFKVLDCPNYEEINADLKRYVEERTKLLIKGSTTRYANFPSTIDLVKHNPKLIDWFSSLGLIMRDAYFTLCWSSTCALSDETSCPIHLDRPPVHWKMNWPVINMERTAVRFFEPKVPTDDLTSMATRAGIPGSKDLDIYNLNYDDFVETHRHDFKNNEPVIMDGLVAHDVYFYKDAVFPRIGFQAMFLKEPTHLL